ncbi:MAG: sigma-54-dependent Fis family transcriptional regulator [Nitrospiraceae bacterium]|nr:MAG: sigma-54-dependent Fis family transcriptional regulator [Nitrospiraceae bacterium]
MASHNNISQKLIDLKMRLEQVNRSWTLGDHEGLLRFYVFIIPRVMDAERCSIFVFEPGTDRIWLKCGTGLEERQLMPPREDSIVGQAISSGRWVIANGLETSPYHADLASKTKYKTRNVLCAPIRSRTKEGVTGAIEVLNKRGGNPFTDEEGNLLQEVADHLSAALENIVLSQEILEVTGLLNHEIDRIMHNDIKIIAKSRVMQNIINTVRSLSASPVNVLIHGESGTGKELIARLIHKSSDRRDKPFVTVNCASIPENLMESEFFGYEKGAFTGAVGIRRGRFEEADGGTLFLDEIRDLPLAMQPKFLRVLQEGEGSRLGSNTVRHYDLRIISATNRDLRQEVASGQFREDLFYRIFSVDIYIPPLRERREDIIPMAVFFLNSVSKRFRKKTAGFCPEVLDFFQEYCWPGNVRQLLHEVERLVALTREEEPVSLMYCSPELQSWKNSRTITDLRNNDALTLAAKVRDLEIRCIKDALEKTGGNKLQSSKMLGITRPGLDKKMKRYNIKVH